MAQNQDIHNANFYNPTSDKLVGQIKGTDGTITMGGNGVTGELWVKESSGSSVASVNGAGELALRVGGNPVIHLIPASGTGWFGGNNVAGSLKVRNNQSQVTLNVSGEGSLVTLRDSTGNSRVELDGENGKITFLEDAQPKTRVDASGIRAFVDAGEMPDYVFREDYALRPLEAVKQFVAGNGHLPDLPGAEDVARDGLDLGQLCLKLLQKIEELTLYSISQEESLNAQATRIEALEGLVAALVAKEPHRG